MSSRSRLTLVLILGLVALGCVRLGVWQLSRLQQRRAINEVVAAARREPILPLNAPAGLDSGALAHRRVRAVGQFDADHELVLRGASHEGVPGVHVLTPLRLTGQDEAVLVDRGFVPSPDAATILLDSLREPGTREIRGIAVPFHDPGQSADALPRAGNVTVRRLNLKELRYRSAYPLLPVYILQSPDRSLPPVPHRLNPPPLDDGPHFNYALQWFMFAGLAVIFAGVALWQGRAA